LSTRWPSRYCDIVPDGHIYACEASRPNLLMQGCKDSRYSNQESLLTYLPVLSCRLGRNFAQSFRAPLRLSYGSQTELSTVSRRESIQCSCILEIVETVVTALRWGQRRLFRHSPRRIGGTQNRWYIKW
jgi:hypothetical protein